MLILKCTQKVAKELDIKREKLPQIPAETDKTVLGEWFVNSLRFGHSKILLFANAGTLYSLLVAYQKSDLKNIGRLFRTNLEVNLLAEGFESDKVNRILAEYQDVVLAQTDSRSVLGSMNDLASLYEYQIMDRGGITQTDLNQAIWEINRTPQMKHEGHHSIKLLRGKINGESVSQPEE
jgi:hypothetical protein